MSRKITDFDVLIFDWDGTLMDSVGNIVQAVQHAAKVVGLPVPVAADIRSGIGRSFDNQYTALFLDGQSAADCDFAAQNNAAFRQAFYAHYQSLPARTFNSVKSVLTDLQKSEVLLAIATSGTRTMLDSMLHDFHLGEYFEVTCCGDEFPAKPEPDMLQYIAQFFGLPETHFLMIGDSVNDIYAAQYASMLSVGITSGVDSKADLLAAGASLVIDDLVVLPDSIIT